MKLLHWFKQKQLGSSIDYFIQPRKVKYDWQETPIDWIPNQPFMSYFINQVHMILPEGEFWMCRVFNKVLPQVTDEKLKEDVKAFIRQEAMHATAHVTAHKDYLSERQIDPSTNLAIMDFVFKKLFADEPLGYTLPTKLQKEWDVIRVGLAATAEHLTCALGQYGLYNTRWQEMGADPEMLDLIKWHGAEEIEHRSVAFDLYRHLGGGYFARYLFSVAMVVGVVIFWFDGAARIMRQDPRFKAYKPSIVRPWIWRQWLKMSLQDSQVMPTPFWLFKQQLRFLSPNYDPVTEANTQDALDFIAQSRGALRAQGLLIH